MSNNFRVPFAELIRIIIQNGGLSGKGLLHLPPWLMKTVLFEPLRWIEILRYSKKIKTHRLNQPPIFILGFYRSGTTYLQRMFMQDPSLGHTSLFQTVLPEVMLTLEKSLTPALDSISKLAGLTNPFHRIPLKWRDFPGEEDVALGSQLSEQGFAWGLLFPRSFDKYLQRSLLLNELPEAALSRWRIEYLKLLKKISIASDGRQLVLKNPPNTARIKTLLQLFPDAKFIHIMRSPLEVFVSNKRFMHVIKTRYILGKFRDVEFDRLILRLYTTVMDQYLLQKDLIPKRQLVELAYENFIEKPVNSMEFIYRSLDLSSFDEAKKFMIIFAEQQKEYSTLKHNLQAQTMSNVAPQLQTYIRYWEKLLSHAGAP